MFIWLIFAVLTALVLVVLLTPFYKARLGSRSRSAFDREVYGDQLAEVDADLERGLLGVEEAAAARIEISRRLLSAREMPEDETGSASSDETSDLQASQLKFRNMAYWATVIIVPALSLVGYLKLGRVDLPGQPHAARFEKSIENQKISVLISRVEERLALRPNDGRGWAVIAPVYMRQGRFDDAANAYGRALSLLGEKPEYLTGMAEALISANRGIVPDSARAAYEKVLAKDKSDLRARFRLAQAMEQDGKLEDAAEQYRELMLIGDPESPWRKLVGDRLAVVNEQMSGGGGGSTAVRPRGPSQSDIRAAGAMSARDRSSMINSMVARLAARLKEDGDDFGGWMQLINAHVVLGKMDAAKSALTSARKQFSGDKKLLSQLDQLGVKLGL